MKFIYFQSLTWRMSVCLRERIGVRLQLLPRKLLSPATMHPEVLHPSRHPHSTHPKVLYLCRYPLLHASHGYFPTLLTPPQSCLQRLFPHSFFLKPLASLQDSVSSSITPTSLWILILWPTPEFARSSWGLSFKIHI